MNKPFFDVFPTLKAEQPLRDLLVETEVSKVVSNRERNCIKIHIESGSLIQKRNIRRLEAAIREQLFSGVPVDIHIAEKYHLSGQYDPKTLMGAYRDSILLELREKGPLEYSLFSQAECEFGEGNVLLLKMNDSVVARDKSAELKNILEHIFVERCGIQTEIRFEYMHHEENGARLADELKLKREVAAIVDRVSAAESGEEFLGDGAEEQKGSDSETKKDKPSAGKRERRVLGKTGKGGYKTGAPLRRSNNPDVIFGRDFDGEAIPLEQVSGEMGSIILRGKVMSLETREIRNDRAIVSFPVTDFTDSVSVKLFVENSQLAGLLEELKAGAFVKIKGIAAMDAYDRELAIGSVSGIKKIPDFTNKRTDQSPVKRVELHCHTKMSDMDGVSDVKDIIGRAIEWGQKAIAITDHGVVQAFPDASHAVPKDSDFKVIYGCEAYLVDDLQKIVPDGSGQSGKGETRADVIKKLPTYHAIILAKNNVGRVNLYKLVSLSHINYYSRRPRIPKSVYRDNCEGLLIGSACEAGELYQAILRGKNDEEIMRTADFYDYLEIQPLGNNRFMIDSDKIDVDSEEDLKEINRKIVSLGDQLGKPVVATCDVHFLDPEDEVYRRIIMAGKGFSDADKQAPLYLRTTEEMLEEFQYLGSKKAEEVVITNTNKIADMIEKISPVRPDKCPPVIPDSDKTLRNICYEKAREIYGEELPAVVTERLEKELNSIIGNGFAVMYIIAQKLVWKSNADGYLVGSRGSVGSSLVATMAGITEVNPLSPHYYCKKCHYSDFDSDEVRAYAGGAGCDMPDKICPVCGEPLKKDGFDIPFETFLGFKGNKEPDIDLNFSGDYQSKAHKYTEVIFGDGHTYRAGTVGTLADKTAFGYVKNYYEERGIAKRKCEISRIVDGCVGVRRTTGQHPGGIIVLPHGEDIYSFTPVQHPANDMNTDIITTHFDYHSIDHNLLKLDILGHDDPTMIRMLEDLTGLDAKEIPLDNPEVMSLFRSTEALGIAPEDIGGCPLGTLGIPEFGTDFVIQMLVDTKPKTFSDLIRISGLSHGTDVWLNNAQTLILDGKATISTAICTRDDIMLYLIGKGMDSELSFTIMESVRKGRGLKPEWEAAMKEADVPDWYIWSCGQIKYMFPKAHAAAYVMMAYRIAYCKVFYPLAYYAAYFSIRASAFSYELMCRGRGKLEYYIADYKRRGDTLTKKEQDTLKDMRIVQEMYARGFEFVPIDLYRAEARCFQITDGKLMPSLSTIEGLGDKAADAVVEAAKDGEFLSKDDFWQRTKVSKSVIDLMGDMGILGDMPETNQLSLFDQIS